MHGYSNIGDVKPLPWDSKDKEIFAMLDDICIADKQNPLSMSSNMATVTNLHTAYWVACVAGDFLWLPNFRCL